MLFVIIGAVIIAYNTSAAIGWGVFFVELGICINCESNRK